MARVEEGFGGGGGGDAAGDEDLGDGEWAGEVAARDAAACGSVGLGSQA